LDWLAGTCMHGSPPPPPPPLPPSSHPSPAIPVACRLRLQRVRQTALIVSAASEAHDTLHNRFHHVAAAQPDMAWNVLAFPLAAGTPPACALPALLGRAAAHRRCQPCAASTQPQPMSAIIAAVCAQHNPVIVMLCQRGQLGIQGQGSWESRARAWRPALPGQPQTRLCMITPANPCAPCAPAPCSSQACPQG